MRVAVPGTGWPGSLMTVALVGLIGVIVGGLLGGFASDVVERRRRRAAAEAAARVIAAELDFASKRLRSPNDADPRQWWVGALPTGARDVNFSALAAEAPDNVLNEVGKAYPILDSWNGERERSGKAGRDDVPTTRQLDELPGDADSIASAASTLTTWAAGTPDQTARRLVSGTALIVALVVLAVVGALLLVGRPNVNADTVAGVVEDVHGPTALAECDPAADDWTCRVYTLKDTRSECLSASTGSPLAVAAANAAETGSCATNPDVEPVTVRVSEAGEQLLLFTAPTPTPTPTPTSTPTPTRTPTPTPAPRNNTPSKTSGEAERERLRAPEPDQAAASPQRSLLSRAIRQALGLRPDGR